MRLLINLLPPEKKAELRRASFFTFLQTVLMTVLVSVTLASFSLLSARFIMKKNLTEVSRRSSPETQEFKAVSETIKAINEHATRLGQLDGEFNAWSRLLVAIEQAVPPGVSLSRLDVSPAGAVSLNGTAETRDAVLALQGNLEGNPLFKDVKSPLSNILQRTDVRFEFTMSYVDFRAPAAGLTASKDDAHKKKTR